MRYAISACLMKEKCKYNGGHNGVDELVAFMQDKEYITICPEVLGGLSIPRASCEIVNGRIMNTQNEDCSEAFMHGAERAIDKIKAYQADLVIVQPRSPSCGYGKIYDGTFQGRLIEGNGVFVEKMLEMGINVISVEDFISSFMKKD